MSEKKDEVEQAAASIGQAITMLGFVVPIIITGVVTTWGVAFYAIRFFVHGVRSAIGW